MWSQVDGALKGGCDKIVALLNTDKLTFWQYSVFLSPVKLSPDGKTESTEIHTLFGMSHICSSNWNRNIYYYLILKSYLVVNKVTKTFWWQWRIQDFPRGGGGAPTPKSAIIFQFFAENCMKMKEFGPPGGASLAPPLRSANGWCSCNMLWLTWKVDCQIFH